jgi:hypothetical protein
MSDNNTTLRIDAVEPMVSKRKQWFFKADGGIISSLSEMTIILGVILQSKQGLTLPPPRCS